MNKISTTISVLLVIIVAILLNAVGSNIKFKLDITENKLYTLSEGTKKIISGIKDEVTFKLYMSNLTGNNKAILNDLEAHKKNVLEFLEQYTEVSNKIKLDVILVDPDSEDEDAALRYGLMGSPIQDGTKFFIGLVAINNSVADKEAIISLISPDPAFMATFEFEVTKLIIETTNKNKIKIGVLSSFPVLGTKIPPQMAAYNKGMKDQKPWAFIQALEYQYEFFDVPKDIPNINTMGIDGLIIVHPKDISPTTQFAIDQYVMSGGKVIMFLDELSVFDNPPQQEQNPYGYKRSSELDTLTSAWGLKRVIDNVLGDKEIATEMSNQNSSGNYESVMQPAILSAGVKNFLANARITAGMQNIFIPYSSSYEKIEKPGLKIENIISSSRQNADIPTMLIMSGEPSKILTACNKIFNDKGPRDERPIVAQITGKFPTAFPEGKPKVVEDPKAPVTEPDKTVVLKESKGNPIVVVVSDSDILQDKVMFRQNAFGQMTSSNFYLIQNLIEMTMGNEDLISIRNKSINNRPFTVLEDIKKKAEENTQKEIAEFQKVEAAASEKLNNLQIKSEGGQLKISLTPEQVEEQKKLRDQMAETRKQIRKLQYQQRKDEENKKENWKYFNYLFMPSLILLIGTFVLYFQNRRVR
jgi:ABC-type uncharacterized transport system involved in gliding motility auxiliary subunit